MAGKGTVLVLEIYKSISFVYHLTLIKNIWWIDFWQIVIAPQ
jgi:hypothetical protein